MRVFATPRWFPEVYEKLQGSLGVWGVFRVVLGVPRRFEEAREEVREISRTPRAGSEGLGVLRSLVGLKIGLSDIKVQGEAWGTSKDFGENSPLDRDLREGRWEPGLKLTPVLPIKDHFSRQNKCFTIKQPVI